MEFLDRKMIFSIDNLLTAQELSSISDLLNTEDFVDGKKTAGWQARIVKNNTQLNSEAPYSKEIKELVAKALKRNPLFQAAVKPKAIHSMLISRYQKGMSYGQHVDNAIMGTDRYRYRSDVSFTVFLCDPSNYEGGELTLCDMEEERSFKLDAGSAVIYPSNKLHRVEEVTEGIRLAAVGWVQSLVRDLNKREILFDLDTTKRSLFEKYGKSIELDLISKSYANLLREWSEF